MRIEGQTALITGGGSGLGAATARHFAALGAKVAVLDLNDDAAGAIAEEIGGVAASVDVADPVSVEHAVATAAERFGPPRIVVNCAGIAPAARVVGREGQLSVDVFERVIRVNLLGTYNVMSYAAQRIAALEPLETGERGVIVNTASIAYQDGQVGQSAYAASKGAVAAMCLPAAREFASLGVRIMAIAPGLFRTPMMEALPVEVTDKIAANIPFPSRLGLASEYAELAEHIIRNPYLNGEVIRLDGAARLPRK